MVSQICMGKYREISIKLQKCVFSIAKNKGASIIFFRKNVIYIYIYIYIYIIIIIIIYINVICGVQ